MKDYEITKLGNVATVTLGKSFKTAIKEAKDFGNSYLIQIGDLNSGNINKLAKLTEIDLTDSDFKFALRDEDILLPLRGTNFGAHLFNSDGRIPVITTNQIASIRCDNSISPGFLCWYLNSSEIKHHIQRLNEGSSIPKLSRTNLLELPVKVPSYEKQLKIEAIYMNWLKQKSLYMELVERGSGVYSQVCEDILDGKVEG